MVVCCVPSDNVFHINDSNHNGKDTCLQTLLLLFKCAIYRNKRPFVSTANEALVGTLMTIGDVKDIFAIVLKIMRTR